MKKSLKKLIPLDNPLRLLYHKIRAIIASIKYGFPSKNMKIIGVTGTNGKTTTCNIIAKGLRESGMKVFMFSTVNIIINDEEYTNDTKMTSPDVFELQRLLSIAKKQGCEIAIIETASHGIKMNRVWGIEYDVAVLTNITQDHLDLHRTMKDYVNTKLLLFKNLIGNKRKPGISKTAIINMESDYHEKFLAETFDSVYTYGVNQNATLNASNIKSNINGTTFQVRLAGSTLKMKTSLIGDFNVYNILAAICVFKTLGIKPEEMNHLVSKVTGIPGRMEEIINEEAFKIFVDYAHTEDALEKVLINLKSLTGVHKVITVFGATGDRDRTKRPLMGEVVSRLSDIVILTQDDDYSEKTEDIIKDILPGIERKEGDDFWILPNRKDAIRTALLTATKDDIVLIAGKGDEHVMITNQGTKIWHDKGVIQGILHEMDDNKIMK